jgi:hypothetical protein
MKVSYSFTEELVLNRDANPLAKLDFRYYRAEIAVDGIVYEYGYLWLPPMIDITSIEDLLFRDIIYDT